MPSFSRQLKTLVLLLAGCASAPTVRPCTHGEAGVTLTARVPDLAPPIVFAPPFREAPLATPLYGSPTTVVVTVHNGSDQPVHVWLRCGTNGDERPLETDLKGAQERDLIFQIAPRREGWRFACEVTDFSWSWSP